MSRRWKSLALLSLVLALQAVPAALDHGEQPQACAAGAWRRFPVGQPAAAVAAVRTARGACPVVLPFRCLPPRGRLGCAP